MAIKRLERGLILDEIARKHNIHIDEQSLTEEFNQTLNQLAHQGAVDFEKLNKSNKVTQERFSNAVASQVCQSPVDTPDAGKIEIHRPRRVET